MRKEIKLLLFSILNSKPPPEEIFRKYDPRDVEVVATSLFKTKCKIKKYNRRRASIGVCTVKSEKNLDNDKAYEHRVMKALANYVMTKSDIYTRLTECEYILFIIILSKLVQLEGENDEEEKDN